MQLVINHYRKHSSKDSITAHTARASTDALREVSGKRVISSDLQPACSPDLNPCDFYLWRNVEQDIYRSNPRMTKELKENI
jgi:hypothetical protein